MFTRYSGIDVPQNYSGNRFRNKSIEDTGMKIHTNQTQGAIKSSVSPSFEQRLQNEQGLKNDDEITFEEPEIVDDVVENQDNDISDIIDASDENDELIVSQKSEPNSKSILGDLNLSPITEFLKSISGEDLLLIALIIFLASDKNVSNNDIIILLALLLVHT